MSQIVTIFTINQIAQKRRIFIRDLVFTECSIFKRTKLESVKRIHLIVNILTVISYSFKSNWYIIYSSLDFATIQQISKSVHSLLVYIQMVHAQSAHIYITTILFVLPSEQLKAICPP